MVGLMSIWYCNLSQWLMDPVPWSPPNEPTITPPFTSPHPTSDRGPTHNIGGNPTNNRSKYNHTKGRGKHPTQVATPLARLIVHHIHARYAIKSDARHNFALCYQIFIDYYMHLHAQYLPLARDQKYQGNQGHASHIHVSFLRNTKILLIIVQSCLAIGMLWSSSDNPWLLHLPWLSPPFLRKSLKETPSNTLVFFITHIPMTTWLPHQEQLITLMSRKFSFPMAIFFHCYLP